VRKGQPRFGRTTPVCTYPARSTLLTGYLDSKSSYMNNGQTYIQVERSNLQSDITNDVTLMKLNVPYRIQPSFTYTLTLLTLPTFTSDTGRLTVFEQVLPGTIQRAFYIYGVGDATRAGHRHHKAWNALICVAGKCRLLVNDGIDQHEVWLDQPDQCVVLAPIDWHVIDCFAPGTVLWVLSNERYDSTDYIFEPYDAQ
jgi:hypothetical protein